MPYRREGATTALKMLGPAAGGNPRTLVLDRRFTNPMTEAVADALAAACVAGLSLESSDTPSHLIDLLAEKDTPST